MAGLPGRRVVKCRVHSYAERINDCDAKVIITADEGRRGGKTIALKANVDARRSPGRPRSPCAGCQTHRRQHRHEPSRATSGITPSPPAHPPECRQEAMNAEDPLFILHTSGSTGSPGRAARDRRLSGLILDDARIYFRLSPMAMSIGAQPMSAGFTGHSYIVYGPFERCDHPDVRRRPQLLPTRRASGR